MDQHLKESAIDYAAREAYAIRCHTEGPRILAKYASSDIMDRQYRDAEIIINAYLEFTRDNG